MHKVYLVQMKINPCEKKQNMLHARELILAANPQKGSLIILPEMFTTGYIPENPETFAEEFESSKAGATAKFLKELADETQCYIQGAAIAKKADKITNHTSIFTWESDLEYVSYDKNRLFFAEKGKISAGSQISTFKLGAWTIAPTICYDLRFPELYRDYVKKGANLITVQAAWPKCRQAHWTQLLVARAIENQCYVVAANCCGLDANKLEYAGNSMVIDPEGNIISQANYSEEKVLEADLDFEKMTLYRAKFPVLEGIFG